MYFKDPSSVLFIDSPFIPKIVQESLATLNILIHDEGFHPVTALAQETRSVCNEHSGFMNEHSDWIFEHFEYTADLFFFGTIIPSTFIIAADMLENLPPQEIIDFLFPDADDKNIQLIRDYMFRNLDKASTLINPLTQDPFEAVKPLFDFCKLDVLYDDFWFFTGLEVGIQVYQELSRRL